VKHIRTKEDRYCTDDPFRRSDVLDGKLHVQFFISSGNQAPYWLDGKHVVFGKVSLSLLTTALPR